MLQICRTCMKEITDESFFYLDLTSSANTQLTIRQTLSNCIPELDLSVVPNPVMCSKCVDNLLSVFEFKKNCLKSEIQINKYIQQVQHGGDLNLVEIVRFHQPKIKNMDTEVKMEEIENIEDFKNENLVCDTSSFNEASECTEYTEPQYLLELQKVEIEDVLFNTFDDDINYNLSTAEENSNTHKSNIAQNCLQEAIEHQDEEIISRRLSTFHKNLICYYRCSLCKYLTKYKSLFDFHIRIHLIKKNYKPTFNHTKAFRTTIKVNKTNIKGNKRKFVKNYKNCYKHNFKNQSKCKKSKQQHRNSLKTNIRAHIVEKLFKCAICEYQCNFKANLKQHIMRIHTEEKPFSCSICEYRCNNKGNLQKHILIHTGEKPFACSVCKYQCNRKEKLKEHMRIHTGEKPFACSVCKYQCSQNSDLKKHMIIHTGEKPFACSVCEYRCSWKASLKEHMRIHTGEKPFACSACKYQCSRKGDLKKHMIIHTGEKPFACSVCEYRCSWRASLKEHMRIHTGEKPIGCSICKYQSSRKADLKKHMLIHTREKPFSCSDCEYQCSQKNNLKKHIMRVHML